MECMPVQSERIFTELAVYYFSGTGNARAVAEWVSGEAEAAGLGAKTVSIPDVVGQKVDVPPRALIGICFPTHGFNAPPLLYRFIRSLPTGDNYFFLANTRGGTKFGPLFLPGVSGVALLLPMLLMRLKGYRFAGMRPVDLPSNWLSLHPAIRGRAVTAMVARCRHITRQFASAIFEGRPVRRWLLNLPIDLLIAPIALLYYVCGRFFLAKTLTVADGCNGCGLCEKHCPVGAITMENGRPFWTFRCESCMKCISFCPERAIEVMHGVTAVCWVALFSVLPAAAVTFFSTYVCISCGDGLPASCIRWLVCFFPGLLLLAVGYRGVHRLMKFRNFSRLVALTSLTHYRWWGRYRFPAEKKNKD